ncbi:response regulator [Chitinophaga tropicalis]|uniref:Response regulator n=1 Tax=Chitinophaga tropicalis TaxID=2683588 RepID=A0A7K1U0Q7_9BACT|nr:response regulator [Chitinophaga tropicalis]MVT07942.1 response regulator [Chitinophaga tropicalis]
MEKAAPDQHIMNSVRTLIALLEGEGIRVNAAAAIDLYKVLSRADLQKYDSFYKLRFLIAPVICRNKEEQEEVYSILENAGTDIIRAGVIPPTGPGPEKPIVPPPRKPFLRRIKAEGILLAVLILAGIYYLSMSRPIVRFSGKFFAPNPTVIHRPVTIAWQVNDTVLPQYKVTWQLLDTTIAGPWKITPTFDTTGIYPVFVTLTNGDGKELLSDTLLMNVLCDTLPGVYIRSVSSAPAGTLSAASPSKGNNASGKPAKASRTVSTNSRKILKHYIPELRNPTADSQQYRYSWYVNDSLVSSSKELVYNTPAEKYNAIRLTVSRAGPHCGPDAFSATLQEVPPVTAAMLPGEPLIIPDPPPYSGIWALFLIPLLFSVIVYSWYSKRTSAPKPSPGGKEEPHSIVFNEQEHLINPEQGLNKLADVLRKRQISDNYKLNIRKTVYSTIAYGGLPQLSFTPVAQPSDYLILLDKEYHNSHITRLYEYFLRKLQREQVNVTVYEYYKEPLFLSNEKLNHRNIPIDRLATLYGQAALFIFGDARHFMYPIKGKLKSRVMEKLSPWKKKIFVTGHAPEDWDKKEKLLISAGFTVIPADISAQLVLDKLLFTQVEAHGQPRLPSFYPSRFLHLNEPENIRQYLNDPELFRWVCALAIYPYMDWNLTIAIGHALNDEMVTYSNLLKLGRISWMHDVKISDTLRIKLLGLLDKPTEIIARGVLLEQLSAIKDVKPSSLIKSEYDTHRKLNAFLKKLYNNEKISAKEKAIIHDLLKRNYIDEGNRIYLNDNDTSIGIDDYFRRWKLGVRLMALYLSLGAFVLLLTSMYVAVWNRNKNTAGRAVITQTLDIRNNLSASVPLFLQVSIGDSAKIFQVLKDTSFIINHLRMEDSLSFGSVILSVNEGELLIRDSFQLNRTNYRLVIDKADPVRVNLYYDISAEETARTIEGLLPANFQVNLVQTEDQDTGFKVICYDTSFMAQAWQSAEIINRTFNRNITAEKDPAANNNRRNWAITIRVPVSAASPVIAKDIIVKERFKKRDSVRRVPPTAVLPATDTIATEKPDTQYKAPERPPEKSPVQQEPSKDPGNSTYTKYILWVDDHPENNTKLINSFREAGWQVALATSNEEAYSLFAQSYREDRPYLVISDIGRDKEGPDAGMELMKKLKSMNRYLSFIFYTSGTQLNRNKKEAMGYNVQVLNGASALESAVLKFSNAQKKY